MPCGNVSSHHLLTLWKAQEMTARERLLPALFGVVIFVALGREVDHQFWTAWWFYVGLGIVVAVVFVEPFYGRAQDAIVAAVGGVGAWASADRGPVEGLWIAYLVFCVVLLMCGGYAALASEGETRSAQVAKVAANHASKMFGRAASVGGAALTIQVVALARRADNNYIDLAFATGLLLVCITPNWGKALRVAAGRGEDISTAVAATGPRLLLVQSKGSWRRGERVLVRGSMGSAAAWVVGAFPSRSGRQVELALEKDIDEVCAQTTSTVTLERASKPGSELIGLAGPGSTDIRVSFSPMVDLRVGESIQLGAGQGMALYQVTSLGLDRETRGSASAVLPHAAALLVGRPEAGSVVTRPRLPQPHEPLLRAQLAPQSVPTEYTRLGVLRGTEIEIGVNHEISHTGHFAVLGMSGMGKTTAALAVCRALSTTSSVIALDTTGEYRNRQGIPVHTPGSPPDPGFWVHEPTGEPSAAAKTYIETTMNAANAEYVAGTPSRRVLLLEEAHGFVPEGNISTFAQRDATAESTRFIMQARKFELRFVMVSQRTAVVSKSALSQCENYVVLRTTDETSLTYLEAVMGREAREVMPRLQRFEAVCMGPAFNADGPVIIALDPPP
jgi:hypothetical protein